MANEKEDKADLKKMADELKSCISISLTLSDSFMRRYIEIN